MVGREVVHHFVSRAFSIVIRFTNACIVYRSVSCDERVVNEAAHEHVAREGSWYKPNRQREGRRAERRGTKTDMILSYLCVHSVDF